MLTSAAGTEMTVLLVIALQGPGTDATGGITATADHPPILATPTLSPAPAVGTPSTLSLSASDADLGTDPDETLSYVTMVLAGDVLVNGAAPKFANIGHTLSIQPLDATPIELLTFAVDSKYRADFWTVNLVPSTGMVTTGPQAPGYAHSVAGDHLDLVIVLAESGVVTYADTGAARIIPDDELAWLGGRIASLNLYPLTVNNVVQNDELLRVTLTSGVDRQFIVPEALIDAIDPTIDEDAPPLPTPTLDPTGQPSYAAGDVLTLTGANLDGASRLWLQSTTAGTTKYPIDFALGGNTIIANLPATLPVGSYTATVRTYGTRIAQSNTFSVTAPVNTVVITPSSASTPPRGSITFTASGGSGTGYTFALGHSGSGGTIDPMSGAYVAGTLGSTIDIVTVTDSANASTSATIQVTGTLSINPSSPSTPPRGAIAFTTSGGSGEGVTWTLAAAGSGGTIDPETGAYTAGTIASTTDTITATDSLGNAASVMVTVTAGLSITPSSASIAPRGSVPFTANGGVGASTWSFTSHPSGGTIDSTTGAYQAGTIGNVTDVIQALDTVGNLATASITVGPTLAISPTSVTVVPRGHQTFIASGGTGAYQWALTTNHSNGSVSATGDYTAGTTPNVTDVVTLTDSSNVSVTATITVGPGVTLTPTSPAVAPMGTVPFVASGGSNTGFTFVLTSHPSGGSINSTSGAYTAGATGGTSDIVRVTDSLGNTAMTTVTIGSGITITPSNPTTPPLGTLPFAATGGSGTGYLWSITTSTGATIGASSGSYQAGRAGSTTDVVHVIDSLGNSASTTVTVTAPVTINPSSTSVPPHGPVAFIASGGSGAGFHWAFVTNGSGGTINSSTGAYTAGSTPSTSDVIMVTDGLGNTASATISVGGGLMISPPNPTLAPRGTLGFAATGGSGTGFVWAISSTPAHGTINATSGVYLAGSTGSTTDTIAVVDSLGNTATTTVTLSAGVTITPSTATVAPRGTKTFVASGGSGAGFAWSITSTPVHGAIDPSTGIYTAGTTGSTSDTIQVVDSFGNTQTAVATIGPAISISPSTLTIAPMGTQTFSAAGGNGSYTFALVTNGSGATLNTTTGAYTAGHTASTTDMVSVSDTLGNTAVATITVGSGIVITPASPTLAPRATQTFTASGGSGTSYTWSLTGTAHGSITPSTGVYAAPTTGSTTDTVKVVDSLGNSATTVVTIGPGVTISPTAVSLAPRATQTFTASGGSGTSFVFSISSIPAHGTINSSSGLYTAGTTGSTSDTITVTDPVGNTATATVTIGPAVAISPSSPTIAPMGTQTFTATGGNGSYTFALITNGSGATLNTTSGAYTAGPTASTTDKVSVTDTLGNTALATITVSAGIVIAPANPTRAPRATQTFTGTGGSGTGYTWSLTGTAHGSINPSTGVYTAPATGPATDTVKVVDSLGNSATTLVTIGPGVTLSPASVTLAPRATQTFTASGGSGTGFVYSISSTPANGSINSSTGVYTAPTAGGTSDTITVVDSLGNSATATVTISAGVTISPTFATVAIGTTQTFTASGGSGTGFAFTISTSPAHGSINSSTGVYTAGSAGLDIVVTTDSLGNSASAMVTIPPALAISPTSVTLAPNGTQTFTASGGSATGYVFSITGTAHGTINPSTGAYTAGNVGSVSDTVKVVDSLNHSATAADTLPAALSISPTTASVVPNQTATFTATGGKAPYTFSVTTATPHGTISSTGVYTAGGTGSVSDTVQVKDANNAVATATVTIGPALTLTPQNPTITWGLLGGGTHTQQFTATGGAAARTWSIVTTHASTLTTGGLYTAGGVPPLGGYTDTVTVSDGFTTVQTTVTVQLL